MQKTFFGILLILMAFQAKSQTEEELLKQLEKSIENNESSGDQAELSDQVDLYSSGKLNLNTCGYRDLIRIKGMRDREAQAILNHRKEFGPFISVLELQTIPELNMEKLRRLMTIANVSDLELDLHTLRKLLKLSEKELVFKSKTTKPRSQGELGEKEDTTNAFFGSPENLQIRFRGKYKRNLIYGICAEKDAGEEFFKGSNSMGFDFHSIHFFLQKKGIIQKIALGDFKVSFGQGLVVGSGFGSGKSAMVLNVKKAEMGLVPYRSFDENNFMRGAGANLALGRFEYTLFVSRHKVDALLKPLGLDSTITVISSFAKDGYHRTASEIGKENKVVQEQIGQALSFSRKRLFLGSVFLFSKFNVPIYFENKGYNNHYFKGQSFYKSSLYFEYFILNAHVFGELAFANNHSYAGVVGLFISLHSDLDMVLLYRNYSRNYIWNYGNAFSDQSQAVNEKGLYIGLKMKPSRKIECASYFDLFKVPYHSFSVDGPHPESDFLLNASYRFSKRTEIYMRFRRKLSFENQLEEQLSVQSAVEKFNFRIHAETKLNEKISMKLRFEWSNSVQLNSGYFPSTLMFVDFKYKSFEFPLSTSLRATWFNGSDYESRIFALENDVAYSWSIQTYYGTGVKYYVLLKYKWRKKIKLQLKYSLLTYFDRSSMGSGNNQRTGNILHQINALFSYTIQ